MADKTLDAKGLNCPLPILKTKKMLTRCRQAARWKCSRPIRARSPTWLPFAARPEMSFWSRRRTATFSAS